MQIKWIKAIDRVGWFPGPRSRVCSVHFKRSDFLGNAAFGRASLLSLAMPTLFLSKDNTEPEVILPEVDPC